MNSYSVLWLLFMNIFDGLYITRGADAADAGGCESDECNE